MLIMLVDKSYLINYIISKLLIDGDDLPIFTITFYKWKIP